MNREKVLSALSTAQLHLGTEYEDGFVWDLWATLTDYIGKRAEKSGGKLPKKIFHAIGRVIGMNIAEAIAVRKNPDTGDYEFLYIQRPPDDEEFQGKHTPGTGQRMWMGAHETIDMAFERLFAQELGIDAKITLLITLPRHDQVVPPRGMECAEIRIVLVEGPVKEGEWWPYETLPPDLLAYQRDSFVPEAQAWIRNWIANGSPMF